MKKTMLTAIVSSTFMLSACNDIADAIDSDNVSSTAQPATSETVDNPIVSFAPLASSAVISTPNDLLYDTDTSSTTVGRLQRANNSSADVYVATAQLDGWGLGQPFTIKVELPDQQKFNTSLDKTSVQQSGAVLLFKCPTGTSVLTSTCTTSGISSLTYGTDFSTDISDDGIVVTPLKAFESNTGYFLAVTNKVTDNLGQSVTRSTPFNTYSSSTGQGTSRETSLNTLLAGTNALVSALGSVSTSDIMYSATFTTQNIDAVAQAVLDDIKTNASISSPTSAGYTLRTALANGFGATFDDGSETATLLDNIDIYTATLTLPYYLPYPGLPSVNTDLTCNFSTLCGNWLNSSSQAPWEGSPIPVAPTPVTGLTPGQVSVLLAIPNSTLRTSLSLTSMKVAQFVHGITGIKETGLLVAGPLAKAGFITVMIDQPLHGSRSFDSNNDGEYEVTATSSTYSSTKYKNGNAAVFGNLSSLLTTRDNLRQAASDQLALKYALANTDLSSFGGASSDTTTGLVGVSLGSIVATQVLGMAESYDDKSSDNNYDYSAAVLNVGGSQTAPIMGYSNSFGSLVKTSLTSTTGFAGAIASSFGYTADNAVLLQTAAGYSATQTSAEQTAAQAQLGITEAQAKAKFNSMITLGYGTFLKGFANGAQTVLDAGDSLAWASKITSTPVLAMQVIGNGVNLSDQTIPNSTASNGFPLGGTTPWLNALNLTKASQSTVNTSGLHAYTNFLVGKHGSLLSSSEESGVTTGQAAAATTEMQTQMATFLATGGTTLSINNSNVVE
ncbi:hypothetical protein GV054_07845 [Marinomonas mediterranea]|uniref:hypothetical protein n=1 Tax=Marinomonas mediterranea TaxID=119864 RepID=UPI00234BFF1F|nr:hypothetical protein [Marinomonas mediterranea]WCN12921.1 hypothetical protein GV054_07845 [Marinomonas mediterranea]